MNSLKRGLAFLIVLLLLVFLAPGAVSAYETTPVGTEDTKAVSYADSGRTSVQKLSMDDLRKRLDQIPVVQTMYTTEPIVSGSNYRPSVLTQTAREHALKWINYYRNAAGLESVTFTETLNQSAAWGALCLAMIDQLTHTPSKPDDMSQEDYSKAYAATSSSNISWAAGYPLGLVLQVAVQGQIEDEDAGNIQVLGHRRWLLNPGVQTMGVGTANTTTNYMGYILDSWYTDIRVFGSNVTSQTVSDYDFIAWPTSGDNLSNVFLYNTPWSITLNPARYATPDKAKVKVVLTRKSDGKKWTFSNSTNTSTIGEDYDYFNVNNGGYGVSNCIIFRPACSDQSPYDGEYTVDVTGITDRSGNAKELHYIARFTAYDSNVGHDYSLTSWSWTDDYSYATANFTCKNDSTHVWSEEVKTTKKTTAATCTADGKTVYTATVKLDGKTYTDTKTVTIPKTGHSWSETATFKWTGFSSATATRLCRNNSAHKLTAEAVITSEVVTEPTETEPGLRRYEATATFSDGVVAKDTKEEVIPALSWEWERLYGSNRYATMEKITRKAYADGSQKTLIVATGEFFPDALAGAALAGVYECPIITTKQASLSPQAKSEIQRLYHPEGCRVLILGGTAAVSQAVEDAIRAIDETHIVIERIVGRNRELTAVATYLKGKEAENGFTGNDTFILTTGGNYADALSISPYAYASRTPIFLTKITGDLRDEVKEVLCDPENGFRQVILLGGANAVTEETESLLKEAGLQVLRLSGKNRYLTGAQLMKWELGLLSDAVFQPAIELNIDGIGAATGMNFADALASVSLLGKNGSPLLLVPESRTATIESIVDELIRPNAALITKGYIFGGTGAVSEEIERFLQEASLE